MHFTATQGQLTIFCRLESQEELVVEAREDGRERGCRVGNGSMGREVMEIFGDVETFFKCLRNISQGEVGSVLLDS
jgi:hypothetical protein